MFEKQIGRSGHQRDALAGGCGLDAKPARRRGRPARHGKCAGRGVVSGRTASAAIAPGQGQRRHHHRVYPQFIGELSLGCERDHLFGTSRRFQSGPHRDAEPARRQPGGFPASHTRSRTCACTGCFNALPACQPCASGLPRAAGYRDPIRTSDRVLW